MVAVGIGNIGRLEGRAVLGAGYQRMGDAIGQAIHRTGVAVGVGDACAILLDLCSIPCYNINRIYLLHLSDSVRSADCEKENVNVHAVHHHRMSCRFILGVCG